MFYVTHLPPGKALGADRWNDYSNYGDVTVDEHEGTIDELDNEFDEGGHIRPLDYYFPR